jgi:hypothetical protein
MDPGNTNPESLGPGHPAHYDELEEQPAHGFPHEMKQHIQTTSSRAEDILSILYSADTNDERLVKRLQEVVRETGWYENLAAAVFSRLENALKTRVLMGKAMKAAYKKASQVVKSIWGFAKDHPVFCTFVALAILAILVPGAIQVLGFGKLGPVKGMSAIVDVQGDMLMRCLLEGTFATWWQSTYGGYVPAGSWFSFFQRLGMVWR